MVTSVLLLLAIALVLIGVVTLVVGIVSNTLAWVFVSIGATVLAGVVLYVLYRVGRKEAAAGTGAPQQSAPTIPAPAATPVVPAPTAVPPAPVAAPTTQEFAAAASPDIELADNDDDGEYDEYDEDLFPIAEYDDLRVAEILPLLPELDADELEVVRSQEVATKARATVLARIDELAPHAPRGYGQTETVPSAVTRADLDDEDDDQFAEDDVPEQDTEGARPAPASRRGPLPIAAYDELKVAEILPLLSRLDAGELAVVARHEEQGPNRQTVLNRINARMSTLERRGSAAGGPPSRTGGGRPANGRRRAGASAPAASARTAVPVAKRAAVPMKDAAVPVQRRAPTRVRTTTEPAPRRTPRTASGAKVAARTTAAPARRQPSARVNAKVTPAPARATTRKTTKATTPPAGRRTR